MNKLLATLLILCAGPVWADWVQYADTDDGKQFFLDEASIRGEKTKKVWTKIEFKTPLYGNMYSSRALQELDCLEQRFRYISFTAFTQPGLQGVILENDNTVSPWNHIPPQTPTAFLLKDVCK